MSDEDLPARITPGRIDPKLFAVLTTTAFVLVLGVVFLFDIAVPDRGILLQPQSTNLGTVLLFWGLVTQLGDPWFLLLLATFVYFLGTERSLAEEPRDGAFLLAITFAAFSFIDVLKNAFAAPRPPGATEVVVPTWLPPALEGTFRSITTGTGFAFPSGHALGTTVVFTALASQVKLGKPWSRWAVAAAVIGLVIASRVVIGVHFVVDVAVGIVAGLTLFALAVSVGDRHPIRVFVLGAVLGVLAVVLSAISAPGDVWKAGQWLGASLGGGIAWYLVRPSDTLSLRATAIAGVPIAVIWVLIYVTSPPLVVTVVGTALAAGLTIAAPTLADRVAGVS
jgi:membrane-associated phospholipid phosphatase